MSAVISSSRNSAASPSLPRPPEEIDVFARAWWGKLWGLALYPYVVHLVASIWSTVIRLAWMAPQESVWAQMRRPHFCKRSSMMRSLGRSRSCLGTAFPGSAAPWRWIASCAEIYCCAWSVEFLRAGCYENSVSLLLWKRPHEPPWDDRSHRQRFLLSNLENIGNLRPLASIHCSTHGQRRLLGASASFELLRHCTSLPLPLLSFCSPRRALGQQLQGNRSNGLCPLRIHPWLHSGGSCSLSVAQLALQQRGQAPRSEDHSWPWLRNKVVEGSLDTRWTSCTFSFWLLLPRLCASNRWTRQLIPRGPLFLDSTGLMLLGRLGSFDRRWRLGRCSKAHSRTSLLGLVSLSVASECWACLKEWRRNRDFLRSC